MPLFRLGFRPFYLLGALFAIAAILMWLSMLYGGAGPAAAFGGIVWHGHEMVFGFAAAVLAGFLLTAVRNWTGRPTPTGKALALLAGVWLAARILIVTGPVTTAAIVDSLFLPLLAVAIAVPIIASRNERNYKVLVIVLLLGILNVGFHLSLLGEIPGWLSRAALVASIDLFVVLMAIVGGRVIFAFTKNAIAEAEPRFEPWLETVSFALLVLAVLLSVISGFWAPSKLLSTGLYVAAAASQLMRLALWQPYRTVRNTLLWMLPAAYSWIPFALLLRALTFHGLAPPSAWIHAVTTGAISGLMLAMMMRSTLGHTGRQLVATRVDVAAFLSLQMAAVVRLLASVGPVEYHRVAVLLSGALWIAAFVLFSTRYMPMLLRPRVDGKPG